MLSWETRALERDQLQQHPAKQKDQGGNLEFLHSLILLGLRLRQRHGKVLAVKLYVAPVFSTRELLHACKGKNLLALVHLFMQPKN